jgi:hypothetical protein
VDQQRLMPQIFGVLQILKSTYRNGHIKAAEQADTAMMEDLEVLNVDDDDDQQNVNHA